MKIDAGRRATPLLPLAHLCPFCAAQMPRQLWRLCLCHLLTWFSITAESVFYTDFMGQVIYHGDPTVHTHTHAHTPCSREFRRGWAGSKSRPWHFSIWSRSGNSIEAGQQMAVYLGSFGTSGPIRSSAGPNVHQMSSPPLLYRTHSYWSWWYLLFE